MILIEQFGILDPPKSVSLTHIYHFLMLFRIFKIRIMSNKRARTEDSPMESNLQSNGGKISGSRGKARTINSQFLEQKKCLLQQGIEQVNKTFFQNVDEMDRKSTNFDVRLALEVGEALRLYRTIEELYGSISSGQVVSMGSNDTNQLGLTIGEDEEKDTEYKPTIIENLGRIVGIKAVAAGGISSAALASDGTVYTFGSSDDGALGRVTASELEEGIPMEISEKYVEKQDKRKFVSIKAGDTHTILLSSTGSVYQYGMMKDVDSGKFCIAANHSSCNDCNEHPVKVPGFQQPVKSIESGNSISAAILKDGSLVTWGRLHSKLSPTS